MQIIPETVPKDSGISCEHRRQRKLCPRVTEHNIEVEYLPVSDFPLVNGMQSSREHIWTRGGRKLEDIGGYQPEGDGYAVSSLELDGKIVLAPIWSQDAITGIGVTVHEPTEELEVCCQSNTTITVNDLQKAVPLICVSSKHGACRYEWTQLGTSTHFPSTPVIYANEVGIYQCEVVTAEDRACSLLMALKVTPGASLPLNLLCTEDMPRTTTSPISVEGGHGHNEVQTVLEFGQEELKLATGDFSDENIVGEGGFGKVYAGNIRGTKTAVKVLTKDGAAQLKSEITALTKYRHRNVVGLVGCCRTPPILLFEFMEQGSLLEHLHDKTRAPLSWNERAKILKDSCRGMAWLHQSMPPLIHQDIKSANILLDKHMSAKLGDFGFSYEIPQHKLGRTFVTAPSLGRTEGYYAPEVAHGQISPKADVYSYGVVTLECFSGLKPYSVKREDRKLTDHMEEKMQCAALFGTAKDPRAKEDIAPYLQALFLKVATICLKKLSRRSSSTEE